MNQIPPFVNHLIGVVSPILKNTRQNVSQWANHSVHFFQMIPQHMQKNPPAAVAVVIATNAACFFALRYFVVNPLEKASFLNGKRRSIKLLLVNGLILSGSIASNLMLSKATHYPLNKSTYVASAIAAIVAHALLKEVGKYLNKNEKVVEKKAETEVPQPIPFVVTPLNVESTAIEEDFSIFDETEDELKVEELAIESKKSEKTDETSPISTSSEETTDVLEDEIFEEEHVEDDSIKKKEEVNIEQPPQDFMPTPLNTTDGDVALIFATENDSENVDKILEAQLPISPNRISDAVVVYTPQKGVDNSFRKEEKNPPFSFPILSPFHTPNKILFHSRIGSSGSLF